MSFSELKIILKESKEKLKTFIENVASDDLCQMVSSRISNIDADNLLNQVLQGFGNTENDHKKKRKLVEAVLNALQQSTVSSSHMDRVLNVVRIDFPNYSKLQLLKLVDYCITNIRNEEDESRSWKDLLPSLLELLQDEKYLHYRGSELSGTEYKSSVIKSICSDDWNTKILSSLAEMFGAISMEKSEHEIVIRALCEKLLSVEMNELPPLVHQLLRFTVDQDCKLLILTLSKYFAKKYSEANLNNNMDSYDEIGQVSLKEVQDIESTVLYHIYQASQLKHKILKEFLKFLRNITNAPEFVLDTFITSVLLLVAELYKDQVFEILKLAVVRQIQDEGKREQSMWLKDVTIKKWSVMEAMNQVIEKCNKDSQIILKGMIDFAFILMSIERKSKEDAKFGEIGSQILQKIIRKRNAAGATVLQMLTVNIVENGSFISQYADCLSFMCRKLTLVIFENPTWIQILLEELPVLSETSAAQIIHAIVPLIRVSPRIRETLVIILRKCLYRKGTLTREMAVTGFLELSKNIKINSLRALSQCSNQETSSTTTSNSSIILTQATLERQRGSTTNPHNNATICQEILAILKKCFSHEIEVRLQLYHGLYDVITLNPELVESVSKMLMEHFLPFYVPSTDTLPPVLFEKCMTSKGADVIIQEPIGDLIFVLQKIYIKTASHNSIIIEKLAVILESLCDRMCQINLEHLEMDDTVELFDDIPRAMMKIQTLKLCLNIYEALISYRIGSWSLQSTNFATNIYSLLKGYNRLVEFTKKINRPKKDSKKKDKDKDGDKNNDTQVNAKKGNRISAAAIKLPNTIIDLCTINKILPLLYQESVPWATKEQSSNLRMREDFHQYILQTCLQLLQNVKSLKQPELQLHNINKYFSIGKLLYKHIVLDLDHVQEFSIQCCILGLECFKELCDIMCTIFTSELSNFLNAISSIDQNKGLDCLIRNVVLPILDVVKNSLDQEEDEDMLTKKIPVILAETISHLVYKLPFEDGNNKEVLNWFYEMAKELEANSIAQIIVKLLLYIEECIDVKAEILNKLCIEVCLKSGVVQDMNLDVIPQFKIINEKTLQQIYSLLNNCLKHKLNNVAWFLKRLKAEQAASLPGLGDESIRESLKEKDRNLCSQLNVIVQILEIFTNTAVDPGPNIDATFKNLHLLYNTLSQLIKYFHSKSSTQNLAFQSVGFIAVIQRAGKSLKSHFYNLITHIEEKQEVGKSNDTNVQRNKILKETKTIPRVIFEIEQFQKDLLFLEKKTGIPLEKYTKHSVNRDFRIKKPNLIEALEKMDVSALTTQANTQNSTHTNISRADIENESETTIDEDSESSSPKRARLH